MRPALTNYACACAACCDCSVSLGQTFQMIVIFKIMPAFRSSWANRQVMIKEQGGYFAADHLFRPKNILKLVRYCPGFGRPGITRSAKKVKRGDSRYAGRRRRKQVDAVKLLQEFPPSSEQRLLANHLNPDHLFYSGNYCKPSGELI